MKKEIFYLKTQPDPYQVESINLITWIDWIGLDAIASPDLVVLIEKYYFEN